MANGREALAGMWSPILPPAAARAEIRGQEGRARRPAGGRPASTSSVPHRYGNSGG